MFLWHQGGREKISSLWVEIGTVDPQMGWRTCCREKKIAMNVLF
jgi:hypothetical protein